MKDVATKLMDSRRFVALFEGAASVWMKKKSRDEERAAVLEPVLAYFASEGLLSANKGIVGPLAVGKAPRLPAVVPDMDEEELARVAAEVDATPQPNKEAVIRRAIKEVIKPALNTAQMGPDGFKKFRIKLQRHGQALPVSEGWAAALKAEGIPYNALEIDVNEMSQGFVGIKLG